MACILNKDSGRGTCNNDNLLIPSAKCVPYFIFSNFIEANVGVCNSMDLVQFTERVSYTNEEILWITKGTLSRDLYVAGKPEDI